jgi:hypothetical protein
MLVPTQHIKQEVVTTDAELDGQFRQRIKLVKKTSRCADIVAKVTEQILWNRNLKPALF